jgi:urease accessory protein
VATLSVAESERLVAAPSGASFGARGTVRAELRLDFERNSVTGRTALTASKQEPPLRVVRAFAQEDGGALVHLHNVSGGLLGGDELALSVRAGAESRVQITTTGATRIYRARAAESMTIQRNEIVIGEHALVEYLPDAIIPYSGARFSQRTAIRLERGAGLFWWEILAAGREARGEIFEYECVELTTDLTVEGKLVAAERVRLEPGKRRIASLPRMGEFRTWATLYVCRAGVDAARWLEVERELREIAAELSLKSGALWGVSTLVRDGVGVRCLARSGREVLAGLQEFWKAAKWKLYGRATIVPRKMN